MQLKQQTSGHNNIYLIGVILVYQMLFLLFLQTILCVCEIPDTFRVYVEAVDDDPRLSPLSFTATSTYADGNITLTVHALNSDLSSNRLYSVVIEAGNRARRINSTGVIQLSKLLCQMRVLHASTQG